MLIFLGLVLFVLLVVVHEFGHFMAARRSGVEVEEFGLGFPPRAKLLAKRKGTEYTLNWLPLGGFVKLRGENDSARNKGSFGAASLARKTLIILAGVLMNWLAAAVIFTILALFGMPQLVDNQFKIKSDARLVSQEVFAGYVEPRSPASRAGIGPGDRILTIDGQTVKTSDQLTSFTSQHRGQLVDIKLRTKKGQLKTVSVTLRSNKKQASLGVSPGDQRLVRSTWSAPLVGVGTTVQFSAETLKGIFTALKDVFTGHVGRAGEAVTGPVGIVVVLGELASQGWLFVLFLIGIISVSLAVMNVLPIPALDGGRLFVMLLFRLIRRPLSKELEDKIHGTGMVILLLLALLITVVDVRRFW